MIKLMDPVEENKTYSSGYGKRPLWQWILLYVVIGAVVYGLIYYFVFAKKGGYNYQQQYTTPQTVSPSPMVTTTPTGTNMGNILMTKTSPTKGQYLTDFAGMTLYVFDKDTPGVSACTGGCAQVWPPYSSGATAQKTFPVNVSVLTRSDGTKQFAYKGMPLYYYKSDAKPGDMLGDGVGNVWHIVKP